MSVAFNCITQSSLFLSPCKCGFYKHQTVESGFKRLLTSSGMSTRLWSLSCGSRGMQHMSCLDFRAARRDTVHTSCPCPHPREHTPITSKECERAQKVKTRRGGERERNVCTKWKETAWDSWEIPSTKESGKWNDFRSRDPCFDCMQKVCDRGWKKYTKIWFLSLPSVLTGSLQWEPYAPVHPLPIRSHWPRNVWAMQTGKDELSSSSNQPTSADP